MTNEEFRKEIKQTIENVCQSELSAVDKNRIERALEKYTPKKPHIHTMTYADGTQRKMTQCPFCWDSGEYGFWDTLIDKGRKYCDRCGQKLDWSDTE